MLGDEDRKIKEITLQCERSPDEWKGTIDTFRRSSSPGQGLEKAVKVKWRMTKKGTKVRGFKDEATEFNHWMVERGSDKKLVKDDSEVPDLRQEGLRILRNMEEGKALSREQRVQLWAYWVWNIWGKPIWRFSKHSRNVEVWSSQGKPGMEASMWSEQARQRAEIMVPRRDWRVKQTAKEEEGLVKAIEKELHYTSHRIIQVILWKVTSWSGVGLDGPKHIWQI